MAILSLLAGWLVGWLVGLVSFLYQNYCHSYKENSHSYELRMIIARYLCFTYFLCTDSYLKNKSNYVP